MRFQIVGWQDSSLQPSTVYLRHTDWDDWFKYETLFNAELIDSSGKRHDLGGTKIGRFGLRPARRARDLAGDVRRPEPPATFDKLPEDFFSLAQDSSFYELLNEMGESTRDEVLSGLRDIAYDLKLLERARREDVTRVSLLRSVPLLTVREQFHRLAHGGVRLTPYNLRYTLGYTKTQPPPQVKFVVDPGKVPPTNIHVLIGRNGVGKSTFLNNLAAFLVRKATSQEDAANSSAVDSDGSAISNLVSVSFSAFDAFEPITVHQDRTRGLTYHYVGLKKKNAKGDEGDSIKGPAALAREMTESLRQCFIGARRGRLIRALRLLEGDPIFADAEIADAVEGSGDFEELQEYVTPRFRRLSSGHKIVLLTTVRLVETVEEKSLVLLDEPEAHLHPPLLSAFVRALGDLLTNRNGVAIVATHSPVVLQEVPKSCVTIIGRSGDRTTVHPPVLETFGENVGTLTDEVFGLEVTATGFHRMLWEAASTSADYETALAKFDGQVGAEGKAILRAMVMRSTNSNHVAR